MASVTWQAVCIYCGVGGSKATKSESTGAPTWTPPVIGGTCPSSPNPDKKHKSKWERT